MDTSRMYSFPGYEYELIYTLENTNHFPFWINICGITYPNHDFHFVRNFSTISAVEYIISGKGVLEINGHSYIVSAGDTCILPTELSYAFYSNFSDPMEKIFVIFEGPMADYLLNIYKLKNKYIFKDVNTRKFIEHIHEICVSDLSLDEIHRRVTLVFTDMIIYLHQSYIKSQKQNAVIDIEYIALYIKNHLYDDLDISTLAKLSNFNKDYFIRTFKKELCQTPYQYIIEERLKLAKALLASTYKSIQQIANELKWNDAHNFTRIFKSKVGMSPTKYRNIHRIELSGDNTKEDD